VEVKAFIRPDAYRLEITDGGPGFDTSKLMAQTTDETLTRQCGRGLPLIHMVMDEVSFNETGNQIRMLLKKKDA
jgi:anti-sigma regulatory factor (Ser/Thr protein kinase)